MATIIAQDAADRLNSTPFMRPSASPEGKETCEITTWDFVSTTVAAGWMIAKGLNGDIIRAKKGPIEILPL